MRSFKELWFKWKKRLSSPLYLISLMLTILILIAGLSFRQSQENQVKKIIFNQLSSIAEMKAGQTRKWLDDRKNDALLLIKSPYLGTSLKAFLKDPNKEDTAKIKERLELSASAYGYANIFILDKERKPVFSLRPMIEQLTGELSEIINKVEKTKSIVNTDLHLNPADGKIHFDIIAPITSLFNEQKIEGFIVLVVYADEFLFPLIQSWPVPSQTAETLLIKRDGDNVLFLNELRHKKDTALKLRIPLSQKNVSAVRAALGEYGSFEGVDYRGVNVLAVNKPIPNTCWSIEAKIDKDEALAGWRVRSTLIILLMISAIAAQLLLTEVFWQRREKVNFQRLYQAEARARETQALFRVLSESAIVGVYLVQDGLFRYVNKALAEMFGYEPEELIGKLSNLDLTHPDDRPMVEEYNRKRLSGEISSIRFDFRGLRKNGSYFYAEAHGSVVELGGKPAIIGTLIDITERKRLIEELLAKESEIRATLYSIGDAVISTDITGGILMMNPVAERLTGWTETEAKGRPIQEVFNIINEFTREPAENPVERVIREGVVVGLANHTVLISRDGSERPIADSGAPITDSEGNLLGVILVFRDQTAEREAQKQIIEAKEELAKSEQQKAAIFAAISEHVIYQAPDHTILWANRAAADSIGKKPEELIGKKCYQLWHQRTSPCEICPVAQARDTQTAHREEISSPDGRWWHISGYPMLDDQGKVIGMIEVTMEITDRKKNELALKASLREKEILIREIHHRVKNNMQVISSILNLQSALLSDPEAKLAFKECQYRIKSMAMVHEKLYRAKDLSNIDFSDYLKNLAQTIFFDQQVKSGQINLHLDLEPVNLNINVAVPLGLILNELITNAFKHAFPSGRKGNLWISLKHLPEGVIELRVKDDGVGFPKGLDFKKADSLGLIIINTLVDQIDGKIELLRDGGTEFRITF